MTTFTNHRLAGVARRMMPVLTEITLVSFR